MATGSLERQRHPRIGAKVDLQSVIQTVIIGIRVEGIGLTVVQIAVGVEVLLAILETVVVGVGVVGIGLSVIDRAVTVLILLPVSHPIVVGVRVEGIGGGVRIGVLWTPIAG